MPTKYIYSPEIKRGTLYFRPTDTRELTDDELEDHITNALLAEKHFDVPKRPRLSEYSEADDGVDGSLAYSEDHYTWREDAERVWSELYGECLVDPGVLSSRNCPCPTCRKEQKILAWP